MTTGITFDESQVQAIDRATSDRRLTVITGGAGCGKTTIIREITNRLEDHGENVILCAFAGKAAARMREATGHDAGTIHRMLQWNGSRFVCGSLKESTVVVDEASMVNSLLMAEIVSRQPRRLVLVGDEAQLPPVGVGQPFHDIIRECKPLVCNLTTCYRATEAIFKAATRIRQGLQPCMEERTPQEHWLMMGTGSPWDTHMAVLNMVRRGELDFQKDIILSPRNEDQTSDASAIAPLNRDILELVNPHDPGERFKAGDRVICTKNNSELDVWNGTTATVEAVDRSGRMQILTDTEVIAADGSRTRQVDIPADFSKNFKHAYALTVHKSQGSQYRKVVVLVLNRDQFALLNRALVYTAVTRAKSECIVMGCLRTFAHAVSQTTDCQTIFRRLCR